MNRITSHFCVATTALLLFSACSGESIRRPGSVSVTDSGPSVVDAGAVADSGVPASDTGVGMDAAANCDANPTGCGMGQLRGAPPACMCLPGCLPGFTWNGAMCIADAPMDAGIPDVDRADVPMTPDSGVVADTGPADTGTVPDSGVTPDTGVLADTGVADTGAAGDGGPTDGGPTDGGFGIGLAEGEACNPAFNDCRQRPGMTCQALDTMGSGVCMVTCDSSLNQPAALINAACNGRARQCFDIFGQGAANSRCFDAIAPYAEASSADRLDLCDPRFPNMARVPPVAGSPTQVCVPLCTIDTNPTQPLVASCTAALPACSADRIFQDGLMPPNRFGVCTLPVARGAPCESFLGTSCTGTDTCWRGVCRQSFGTTCTATTTCDDPNGRCLQLDGPMGAPGTAFCHQPCDALMTGECGMGGACTITATGTAPNQTAFGTCRAATPPGLGQDGDCSDPFGFGSNRYLCSEGLVCAVNTMGFQNSTCIMLCDPAMPGRILCPGLTSCTAAVTPFDAYGICQ